MATIGNFTKQNDTFSGTVRTLGIKVQVKIVPNEKTTEKSPDYRVVAGSYELGAAWKKTSQSTQREYLSVSLDDPSFPDTIYARLVENEDGKDYSLIWTRNKND